MGKKNRNKAHASPVDAPEPVDGLANNGLRALVALAPKVDLIGIIKTTDLPMVEFGEMKDFEQIAKELEAEADSLEKSFEARRADAQRALSKADEKNGEVGARVEHMVFDLLNQAQKTVEWADRKACALVAGRSADAELATLRQQITQAALNAYSGEIKDMQRELKSAKANLKAVEATDPKATVGEKRKLAEEARAEALNKRVAIQGEVSL